MINDEMYNGIYNNEYKIEIKYTFLYDDIILNSVKKEYSYDKMIIYLNSLIDKYENDKIKSIVVSCNDIMIYNFNNMNECYKKINNLFVLKEFA